MSRIKVLLQDLPPDKTRAGGGIRRILSAEQWDEILAADARGISAKTIFAKCSGVIVPFFKDPKQVANALMAERAARRKAAGNGARA